MKHLQVVAAIIFYEDKILAVQKGKAKFEYISYKYEFPGGKIEAEETEIEALKREIQEELKINIEVEEKFLTVNHKYPDFNITMHSYICKVETKNLILIEHINHKWLSKSDLKTLKWADADLPIVKKLTKTR